MNDNGEGQVVVLTLRKKLQIIKGCLGVPQTEVARRLGVTHAAFSRWWTGKATPRRRMQYYIDCMLFEVSGCRENFFERHVSTKHEK